MKYRVIAGILFASAAALALPPQASFDFIKYPPGGDAKLGFTINGESYTLTDDDGVATLRTVAWMLTQPTVRADWDKVKDQPVKDFAVVWPIIESAAARAVKTYNDMAEKKPELADVAKKLQNTINKLKYMKGMPTYETFNELGEWLDQNSGRHQYDIQVGRGASAKVLKSQHLVDNDSNNEVGTALGGRAIKAPSRLVSRSLAVFDVNLKAIGQMFMLEGVAPGGGSGGAKKSPSSH